MGLFDRVRAEIGGTPTTERSTSLDTWISDFLIPSAATFAYEGNGYQANPFQTQQTLNGGRLLKVANTLPSYMAALQASPPAFAAQMVRAMVLSQARFRFRPLPSKTSSNRKLFGTGDLAPLEKPWPNGTTGELIAAMEWHAGIAGTSIALRRGTGIKVLRPDFVAAVYGSHLEPEDPLHAIDGELLGYVYQQGGLGGHGKPQLLSVADVAAWSPIPDPLNPGQGMSWLTPAIREIQVDDAATDFKARFFVNGATPNLVIKGIPAVTKEQFNDIVTMLEGAHGGAVNAFKTLYLTGQADATVVGSNLKDLDLKQLQGASEARISMLSRVPATVLGAVLGLEGSSLNAGNFGQARRLFADTWVFPQLQDLAGSLASIINVPGGSELWTDTTDMPLLREDAKDAAEIDQVKATAIKTLIDAGCTPEAVIATVAPEWTGSLTHTGLVSVQLQEPGAAPAAALRTRTSTA
jgi:hypothetical protein